LKQSHQVNERKANMTRDQLERIEINLKIAKPNYVAKTKP